ncbi:MAG: uroporphyrinogen decarboxylase [Gammaproteobacteria bacterium]|jgi:uroporphyrinogen decarboxylase|nr:uroporphyrinogen decarboxylase [Gammaproteobacteria bacterium]|tara:strand:+ start:3046 stop:4101 length:1056 start_codon:yes stop_codon:yes gene_type:complete
MTSQKNDRFLRALLRQPVDATPVWIMRQAGRYLPEYRATRAKAGNFLTLCKTPELACEVTMQPLDRFDLDAAILFSDILTIPDAMGLGLQFVEGDGPSFSNPVRTAADIKKLAVPDPSAELRYVTDAVSLIRKELDGRVPLIGFSGSPWTLATYMVEGRSSKDFSKIKALMYEQPKLLEQLLSTVSASVASYLNAQIEAGAQALMIFDTWGGVLTPELYRRYSLAFMHSVLDQLKREHDGVKIPVILFSKGANHSLSHIAATGADGIGLDWTINIADASAIVGTDVAVQGNLDPSVLYSSPEVVRAEVKKILQDYPHDSGHVFNLGHGIHPGIDPENVKALVDAVHEFSQR